MFPPAPNGEGAALTEQGANGAAQNHPDGAINGNDGVERPSSSIAANNLMRLSGSGPFENGSVANSKRAIFSQAIHPLL